jgi:hypothetical protein
MIIQSTNRLVQISGIIRFFRKTYAIGVAHENYQKTKGEKEEFAH